MVPENVPAQAVELRFRLLGPPQIRWCGEPFALPRRQARALLYRLASDLEPLSRDQLTFLFWPDSPEKAARRNLVRLLSYLRQALPHPDLLLVTSEDVRLNPELAWSDSHLFDRLCVSPGVEAKEKAAALYGGRFLDGLSLGNSPEFENWLIQEGQRYERLCLKTLAELLEAKAAEGDRPKAIDYGQRYLAIDSLAETIHCQLISLYAAVGNRGAARRQYEQCTIILERELGVPPLPETRAAYEAARDGTPPPAPEVLPKPEWTTLPGLHLPLIGRDEAWQALTEAYSRYQGGGVIFISGEAGVGKSRLMQEFATAQAGLVLTGNSHATGQALPYQPLVQALRLALPLRDRWGHTLPIWLAEASRLLPELRAQFPDLPPPVEVEPSQAQSRLFEALTQVFGSLATDSPLLLCLDDVHWADEATLGWLEYVTERLAGSGMCIIGTYRTYQAGALAGWRRVLNRARLAAPVRLDGLSETAVAELVHRAGAGQAGAQPLATRIHAATGGNAFFVLETVRELLETGQHFDHVAEVPLPQTVRDAVLRRVSRLTPLAQQVLAVAAVLSPHLRVETLVEASGRGELETVHSLEELLAHQLLQANGNVFRFQHDLARETVYQDISPWRQRLLHRRAAQALTQVSGPDLDGAWGHIAYHYEEAGDYDLAIDNYRRAAAEAQRLYAHEEAITYLRRAIALLPDGQTSAASSLYEPLGSLLRLTGDHEAARSAYELALSHLAPADIISQSRLYRQLGASWSSQGRYPEATTALQTALTILGDVQGMPSAEWQQGWLDVKLAQADLLYLQNHLTDMDALCNTLHEPVVEYGTLRQQADFYSALVMVNNRRLRFQPSGDSVRFARQALAVAHQLGEARLITAKTFSLGFQLLWFGNLDEAARHISTALDQVEAQGDMSLQNRCLTYLTITYRLKGDTATARALAEQSLAAATAESAPSYIGAAQANLAWLAYRTGTFDEAVRRAEAALTQWENISYPLEWQARWPLLAIALQQRDLETAVGQAARLNDVTQQRLPDAVCDALDMAVLAWKTQDRIAAHAHLETAMEMAHQYGYL